MSDKIDPAKYGTPEHAAAEALTAMISTVEGWVTDSIGNVAYAVVDGLRDRGFVITPHQMIGRSGQPGKNDGSRAGLVERASRQAPTVTAPPVSIGDNEETK